MFPPGQSDASDAPSPGRQLSHSPIGSSPKIYSRPLLCLALFTHRVVLGALAGAGAHECASQIVGSLLSRPLGRMSMLRTAVVESQLHPVVVTGSVPNPGAERARAAHTSWSRRGHLINGCKGWRISLDRRSIRKCAKPISRMKFLGRGEGPRRASALGLCRAQAHLLWI